jgi:hypothetical protein
MSPRMKSAKFWRENPANEYPVSSGIYQNTENPRDTLLSVHCRIIFALKIHFMVIYYMRILYFISTCSIIVIIQNFVFCELKIEKIK